MQPISFDEWCVLHPDTEDEEEDECLKCNGEGECSCCGAVCEACEGTGTIGRPTRREQYERAIRLETERLAKWNESARASL